MNMQAGFSSTTPGVITSPNVTKLTRGHSCVLCQQRKVKCDKQKPCSNCTKARVECIASAPTRRRRRKVNELDLATKLRRYEQLLKKNGIKIEDDEELSHDSSSFPSKLHTPSRTVSMGSPANVEERRSMLLFANGEYSHGAENTLWEDLRDEIQDPKDSLQGSSDDEINETDLYPQAERFFVCHGTAIKDLGSLHPQPVHVFRLWQTFLVNVDPLIKLFHAPTVQQTVLDASGDLKNVPKHVEALLFSIYFISVTSMQESECQQMFGDTRSNLLAQFSHGTQQALVNAKILSSRNLMTLNALVLFLIAARKYYDPHSFWILTGTALRVAQRLGLHRDGTSSQISPFEIEMRRRTLWQIRFLDGGASKLSGAGDFAWLLAFDSKPPLKVSDSDLNPNMKEPPTEREGPTEMMFCSLRYEVVEFLLNSGMVSIKNGSLKMENGPGMLAAKDKAVDELEVLLQDKFVRYCDPSIPLHLLTIHVAKSIVCSMRLMSHHPRQYPDKGANMPQSEKDMLFSECLKKLQISAFGQQEKSLQGFKWHLHLHFQLDAFIYILSELRHRAVDAQVTLAWKEIEVAYDQWPEMLTGTKNSLFFAIGNLALKAWAKKEESNTLYHGAQLIPPPHFISILRSQRSIPATPLPTLMPAAGNPTVHSPKHQVASVGVANNASYLQDTYQNVQNPWDTSAYVATMDMTMPDSTAFDWETYQTMLDGDISAYTAQDSGFPGQDWIF